MIRSIAISIAMLVVAAVASARDAGAKQAAPEDRGKIIDQLRAEYQDVLDRLDQNDPGAATRAKQKQIADLLKRLLDENDPPPPAPSGNPPPSNPPDQPAPKAQPMNPPKEAKKNPAPEKSTVPKVADEPQPMANKDATARHNQDERDRGAKSLEEMKAQLQKDGYWPINLPRRDRDSIEAAIGHRFMPRYEELLRAYYRTIAESSRGKREE